MSKGKGGYYVRRGISWPADKGGWHNVEPSNKVHHDLPKDHLADWLSVGAIEPEDTVPDAGEKPSKE
jgi:hypothetical protein